jgi:hypothetical protein
METGYIIFRIVSESACFNIFGIGIGIAHP